MTRSGGSDSAGGTSPTGEAHDADDADSWEELEIEVTDLRSGATVEKTVSRVPAERSQASLRVSTSTSGREDERPPDERDEPAGNGPIADHGQAARTWRRRASAALVVMLVAVVLLGLLISNPGVSARLQTDLFPPTPTIPPGSNIIWFRNTVPWGKLAIDGHSPTTVDGTFTALSLARGHHTLTYDAPPFRALRCTVSVPASRTDTCPQDTHTQNEPNPPPADERALDLGATLDKLPASNYTALVAALQRQLDTSTTVAELLPGDHYGSPDGQVRVAQQPMSITLAFVVAPPMPSGAAESINGAACNPLCAVDTNAGQTPTGWQITAIVTPLWRYTDADGTPQVVASVATGAAATGGYELLTFTVQPAGTDWQATINSYNSQSGVASVECDAAMQGLPPMNVSSGANNGFSLQPGSMNTGTPAAEGCAIAALPVNGNGSASGPTGLLLLRGGALVAANDTAHTLYPMLPLASAHEVALAYQLNTGTSG